MIWYIDESNHDYEDPTYINCTVAKTPIKKILPDSNLYDIELHYGNRREYEIFKTKKAATQHLIDILEGEIGTHEWNIERLTEKIREIKK